MALFNRKKGDTPPPAAPPAGGASKTPDEAFDFDAISRDLDAQNGASSFDSLLAAPAAPTAPTAAAGSNSAFDFPENDPLGLSETPALLPEPPVSSGFGRAEPLPPAPAVMPERMLTEPVQMAPLETPPAPLKAKKSLPLFPILGLLGILAVGGGGAMFLLNSNKGGDEDLDKPEPLLKSKKPKVAKAGTPSTAPGAPKTLVAKAPTTPVTTPTLGAASPGIAPPTTPKIPVKAGTSTIPVRIAQNPVAPPKATLPSATAGLDPAMASKLTALWEAGKEAKHAKDFAGARKAWEEALRLAPKHPGFQESIDKLPK